MAKTSYFFGVCVFNILGTFIPPANGLMTGDKFAMILADQMISANSVLSSMTEGKLQLSRTRCAAWCSTLADCRYYSYLIDGEEIADCRIGLDASSTTAAPGSKILYKMKSKSAISVICKFVSS
jgi:hypothetical protein